jgi:hypothetical protein
MLGTQPLVGGLPAHCGSSVVSVGRLLNHDQQNEVLGRCSWLLFVQAQNHQQSDTVLVKVEFTKGRDADAFKSCFDPNDSYIVNPTRRGLQETMDQVCWWRLMAEETRTQGDQFASADAKETMAQVAMSYDRLADDLERRLANPRYRNGLVVG